MPPTPPPLPLVRVTIASPPPAIYQAVPYSVPVCLFRLCENLVLTLVTTVLVLLAQPTIGDRAPGHSYKMKIG